MRDYAIMFLAINVICCIFCLMQLRLAIFLLGLIVVLPLSVLLLISTDPLGEAMGINVLLVCGAVLYLATKASYDFEQMVSAQVATQELSDANARLAGIDALTGLANRRSLQRKVADALSRGDELALAIVDLDGFKAINDNCGHETGDLLIRQWALDLQATGGPDCFTARLGGDEFALIVEGEDAAARLEAIADAVVRRTRHPIRVADRTLSVGATIGLTASNEAVQPAGELLRQADVAMYAAKCAGKNRFLWFDNAMDSERDTARQLESDLRDAVEEDRFSLIYQPSFDAHSGKIRGVEALLRWDAPAVKAMGPAEFIPLAEETGLIDRLGLTMLRKACDTVAVWPGVVLAVNLSAAQLRNPQFAENVAALLAECRLPPSRLEFEIPEAFVVRESALARQAAADLRSIGVGVVLDDFGTGHASLTLLRAIPFDKVKIDGALVAEILMSDSARAIVQATIAVARSLRMEVVAEGVETEEQAVLLKVAGCDQLQGWHLARGADAPVIGRMLSEAEKKAERPRAQAAPVAMRDLFHDVSA